MKTKINRLFLSGAALTAWLVLSGCSPESSKAETKVATPPADSTNLMVAAPENSPPAADPVSTETSPTSTSPAALPPNISPSSPLAQVIRLTQAGVDQGIIMTFVTNSSRTFNLDSEKIIYLSDLGAPTELITAIMQRDQDLQAQFAAEQAAQQAEQVQATQPAPAVESAPTSGTEVAAQPETQPAPVTINYFYDTLQPYGNWVYVSGCGYCWRPTVCVYNPSWQPYCDRGNWVYTDCGWYWNSDYAWGATFHYGRWFRNPSFGWCWYPGTVWGPSWVTWRYSNNYCGWAPLPPHTTCQAGIGIVYNGGGVSVGFNFGLGANCYTFVPTQHFCDPHPRNYCVAPSQLNQVYNNTTVINNFNVHNHAVVNHGIAVDNIAAATHSPIRPVPANDIHPGFAHFQSHQPDNHFSQGNNASHHNFPGGFDSPLRMDHTAQPRSPQPDHNLIASSAEPSRFGGLRGQIHPQPDAGNPTLPEQAMRADRNNLPVPSRQTQLPAAGFHRQPAPQTGQTLDASHVGTPRPNNWQNANLAMQNRNLQPTPTSSLPGHTPPAIFRQPATPSSWQQAVPNTYNNRPSAPVNTAVTPPNRVVQAPPHNFAPPRINSQPMVVPRQSYQPAPVHASAPSQAPSHVAPQSWQNSAQMGGHGRPGH